MSKFNTSNAANSIVNVIQTSIGNAAFDTTIRAIIQEKVDEATGKFKLQYQDGVFYAFADDVKINYSKGTEVFVLVPKNDFTQDKRIIGSVKTLGENYAKVYSEDERYRKIGASAFGEDDEDLNFGIKSAWREDNGSLLQNSEVILDLSPDNNFLNYLRQDGVDGIWLEATFTTDNLEWVENANYGLTVKFNLQDTDKTLDLTIDANNMVGNPFSLYNERQIVVFGLSAEATIDFSHITGINSVSLWSKDFKTPVDENNIFVKDIKMYAVSAISETQLDAPNAEIWTKNGTYVGEDQGIPLQAQLKIKGKVQTDVKYFWFEEDLSINKDSGADYHVYGGRGWKLLNTTTSNGDGTFEIKEIDKNILWVYYGNGWDPPETDILKTQLDIPKRLYKCVIAKSDSERYEAIVEVTNNAIQTNPYEIRQKREDGTVIKVGSSVTLAEGNSMDFVVCKEGVEQTSVSWYKKDLFDTEWSPIEGVTDQLKIAYASIITQKQIRAMVQGVMTQTVILIAEAKIPDPTPQYQLVIVNTDQTFIYDENGRSPTHPAKTFKENEPKPLSFKLYDTYAQEGGKYDITEDVSSHIWNINSNGLISLFRSDYDAEDEEKKQDKYKYQYTGDQCNFTLKDAWSYDTVDNQITLTVKYADATITAKTNFTFLKQGDPGTNGTDVAIVVTGTPNLNNDGTYKDGLIVTKYIGSEAIPLDDITPQEITYKKGEVTVKTGVYKATVTEGEKVYYGYYVPPIAIEDTDIYQLVGKPSQYVVYDSDGSKPKYADFQFEEKGEDGDWASIDDVTFNGTSSLRAVIPQTFDSTLAASEGVFQITAYDGTTVIATITLLASLNHHAFSMVNGWDGNLKIDDSNNYMLAATVAAGKKNEDNTFTGVMIGTVGDSTSSQNNRTGFFGFNQGVQTAFIDAEDGSTRLGNSAHTLVQIGDNYSEEFLQSGNYQSGVGVSTVTLKDSSGVSTTYPFNQWSSNNIAVVYAESTHTTPIGAIKGTGYNTSSNEPTNTEYIKGYLGSSSIEKYIYVTSSTTALYKEENFSYQLNPQTGMRIDLKNGSILAPGYYLNGTNGNATFEGKVTATSGEFANGVFLGQGDNRTNVGSMLTSLNSKIESISASLSNGKFSLSYKQSGQTVRVLTDEPIEGEVTLEQLSQITQDGIYEEEDGKVIIAATAIKTGMIGVYNTTVSATPVGWLGAGQGNDGNSDTYGVMLSSADRSAALGVTVPLSNYLMITSSGVRLTTAESSFFNREYVAASLWLTTEHPATIVLQSDRLERRIWDDGIGDYRRYIIEIEE